MLFRFVPLSPFWWLEANPRNSQPSGGSRFLGNAEAFSAFVRVIRRLCSVVGSVERLWAFRVSAFPRSPPCHGRAAPTGTASAHGPPRPRRHRRRAWHRGPTSRGAVLTSVCLGPFPASGSDAVTCLPGCRFREAHGQHSAPGRWRGVPKCSGSRGGCF